MGDFNISCFGKSISLGLYGGLDENEIYKRKKLDIAENLFEYMDFIELAANLFCITQTKEQIRSKNIQENDDVLKIYGEFGKKIRQTIKDLGNTMPEDLPIKDFIQSD